MPRGVPNQPNPQTATQLKNPGVRGTTANKTTRAMGGDPLLDFLHKSNTDYSVRGGDIVIARGRK